MLSRFENGQSELLAQKLFSALNAIHTETEEFTPLRRYQESSFSQGTLKPHSRPATS